MNGGSDSKIDHRMTHIRAGIDYEFLNTHTKHLLDETTLKEIAESYMESKSFTTIRSFGIKCKTSLMNECVVQRLKDFQMNEVNLLRGAFNELSGQISGRQITVEEVYEIVDRYNSRPSLRKQKNVVMHYSQNLMNLGMQKPLFSFCFPRKDDYTLADLFEINMFNTVVKSRLIEGMERGLSISKPDTGSEIYEYKINEVTVQTVERDAQGALLTTSLAHQKQQDVSDIEECKVRIDNYSNIVVTFADEAVRKGVNLDRIFKSNRRTGYVPKQQFYLPHQNQVLQPATNVLVRIRREGVDAKIEGSLKKLR